MSAPCAVKTSRQCLVTFGREENSHKLRIIKQPICYRSFGIRTKYGYHVAVPRPPPMVPLVNEFQEGVAARRPTQSFSILPSTLEGFWKPFRLPS